MGTYVFLGACKEHSIMGEVSGSKKLVTFVVAREQSPGDSEYVRSGILTSRCLKLWKHN